MAETPITEFYGQGDPLMGAMFAECVRWAWNEPAMVAGFERDTGMSRPADPMSALVDEATGHDQEIAERFINWVADNVWGKPE